MVVVVEAQAMEESAVVRPSPREVGQYRRRMVWRCLMGHSEVRTREGCVPLCAAVRRCVPVCAAVRRCLPLCGVHGSCARVMYVCGQCMCAV